MSLERFQCFVWLSEPKPAPAMYFCSCWRFCSIFPADSNLSLDLLHVLFAAIANMVCGSERVSNTSGGLVFRFADS